MARKVHTEEEILRVLREAGKRPVMAPRPGVLPS